LLNKPFAALTADEMERLAQWLFDVENTKFPEFTNCTRHIGTGLKKS
jgi:hypothetical protein